MEETKMILNPRERYFNNKGREEGIEKGIEKTIPKLLEIMTPEEISKEYNIKLEKVQKIQNNYAK
jgi:predicted transposase YdaD